MKRIFTLAALFISMVSFAGAPPRAGRMIVTNGDFNNIFIRIDGRTYNVDEQTLVLNNLAGGRHHLEIYKIERKPYGFGRNKPVAIFSSAVYVDPSFIVDVNINRFGRVSVGKSVIVRNGYERNGYDRNSHDRSDYDAYDNDHEDRYNNDRYNDGNKGSDDRYRNGNKSDDKSYQDKPSGNRPVRF